MRTTTITLEVPPGVSDTELLQKLASIGLRPKKIDGTTLALSRADGDAPDAEAQLFEDGKRQAAAFERQQFAGK
jgi:hypothetical protein